MAAEEDSTPHENPDDAEVYYDGVAILGYYIQLLDQVLQRAPEEVEALHEKGPFTNVPEGLKDSLGNFGEASEDIAVLIVAIESDLDEMNELAVQSRFEELLAVSDEVRENLIRAYEDLLTIEDAAEIAGLQLNVPPAGSSDPLREAYDELEGKIDDLRRLLELQQELMNVMPGEDVIENLKITALNLEVDPLSAFVGERVTVMGSLKTEGNEMPDRPIVILLDGVPYTEMRTGPDGNYRGTIQIPYDYIPQMTVQALYYPRSEDVGTYLASKSEPVNVEVLFYSATLDLEVEDRAYPGLDTVIRGHFDYADDPALENRNVEFYLDGRLITRTRADEDFEITYAVAPAMTLGEHRLKAIAPASERYAPVTAEAILNVVKIVPVIDLSRPGMAIMPIAMKISGHVHSDGEPLEGITVWAKFSGHEETAVTTEDGAFSIKISTASLDISLVGSKELEVAAYSESPWVARSSDTWKMVTLNPILIVLVLAVGAIVLAISIRRIRAVRRKRSAQPAELLPILPWEVAGISGESVHIGGHSIDELVEKEENDDRRIILTLYTGLLRMIQGITGISMKPQMTLREFTRQSAAALGPAHSYLDRFTRLVERLLYSRHSVKSSDVDEGHELKQMIEGAVAESGGRQHNR